MKKFWYEVLLPVVETIFTVYEPHWTRFAEWLYRFWSKIRDAIIGFVVGVWGFLKHLWFYQFYEMTILVILIVFIVMAIRLDIIVSAGR